MWNGKRYKNPGSGLVENHNRPSRFISSNFDDLSANNHLEISNREFKWDDPQKKLSADLRAWSLNQSTSCPDFFQKLAAGKVSPAESVEAEQMHAQPPTRPKVPLSDGTMLRHRFCPWDGTEFRHLDTFCTQCGSRRTRSPYSGKQEHLATLLLPPWERVLWKPQPYEDNYVPRSFLDSLVTPLPSPPHPSRIRKSNALASGQGSMQPHVFQATRNPPAPHGFGREIVCAAPRPAPCAMWRQREHAAVAPKPAAPSIQSCNFRRARHLLLPPLSDSRGSACVCVWGGGCGLFGRP